MTRIFSACAKKKRAKAFVTLVLMLDNPCSLTFHDENLNAYLKQHEFLKKEIGMLIAIMNIPSSIHVYTHGGGIRSQITAIKAAIAKAARKSNGSVTKTLRKANYLKGDARKKERKKYGLKKARRASQFSKR